MYGFEGFEKRGQRAQESEIKVIWPSKTSSLSMMKKTIFLLVFEQNLGGH